MQGQGTVDLEKLACWCRRSTIKSVAHIAFVRLVRRLGVSLVPTIGWIEVLRTCRWLVGVVRVASVFPVVCHV